MPARLLTTRFWTRLYFLAEESDLFGRAAQVAFFFTFSLFPLLFFLFSLSGLVLESSDFLKDEVFRFLRQIMPVSVFELVNATIDEIIASSSGSKLTLGLVVTLWTASAGVDTLRAALNSVYGLSERRAWWRTRLQAILFTFAATILGAGALFVLISGREFFQRTITGYDGTGDLARFLQWIVLVLIVLTICEAVYNLLPDYRNSRWHWITPGTLVAVSSWLILIGGFKLYLSYFNTYNRAYGSLGAVMILMLWLYLTSLSLMAGAAVNSTLRQLDDEDTKTAD
ncbi:MAG: YihY/virulence factor BrkB family protein [Acidobacteriota bacterium]|nr:MAG: YihY/virulence factor BrkB family protein [Acidobacteriota bacterium]